MAAEKREDGLLAQHNLLIAVLAADWPTRLDHKVAAVIIQRYYPKFGNARVSLGFLETATKARRPNIITSTRRLCDHGVFRVVRQGKGTRPTEYALNFDFPTSSIADNTTNGDLPSGIVGDTTAGIVGDTTSAPTSIVDNTQTYLHVPADKPVYMLDRNIDTPDPLVAGLSAATGSRDPESAFDRFWSAFPRKHGRKKAEAAWDKIAPDDELAERIIAAGRELAAHYDANPVDKKWIRYPANWLDGKGWTEDLPDVYRDPKEAAIAKRKARTKVPEQNNAAVADNDDEPAVDWTDEISPFVPAGAHKVRVLGATEEIDVIGRKLSLLLNIDVGGTVISEVPTYFYVEHPYKEVQELGQDRLRVICCGDLIEVAADLVGREFRLRVAKDGTLTTCR